MPQLVIILGLVLIPVLLLMVLLWWRFYGGGKNSLKTTGTTKFGNYKSLRTYNYKVRDFVPEMPAAGPNPLPGNILDELVSDEGYQGGRASAETPVDPKTSGENPIADSGKSPDQASVPIEIAAADSGGDTLIPGQTIPSDASHEIEQESGPAQSLYYNPLTAPAPTDNDKRNREAEIDLKKRRRAALKINSQSAQSGLSELFSPDSPAKAPFVNAASDEK